MALKIGCDPEFLVVNSHGSQESTSLSHNDDHGSVGVDHGGRVGELRPAPGTPAEVVHHLKAQMLYVKSRLPDGHKVLGGGGQPSDGRWSRDSIGGHIHFGGIRLNSSYISYTRQRNWYMRGNQALQNDDAKLVAALDYFIGRRLQKVPGGKRPKGSHYGRPGDIETKSHDGGGFEYRTPPSWITDPYLAESTMAVAYRIAMLWQIKPAVFDQFFSGEKRRGLARRKEYDLLIPTSGTDRRYFATQIKRFKRVIFSKTYKMDNPDLLELWTNQAKLDALYGEQTVAVSSSTSTPVTGTVTVRGSRRIQLQVCQVKLIQRSQDFEEETVARVTRFAVPEVKIYPFEDYTPWHFQLTRDIRLRPDTLYVSKELRPFLRVKRGFDCRVRFVEIKRRAVNANGQSIIEALTNCVFYNAGRSTVRTKDAAVSLFEQCVRTRLRSSDDVEDESED